MARAKAAFTEQRYVTYDDEGNAQKVDEPFDEDGNLKEGVTIENVNYKPGDAVDSGVEAPGFIDDDSADNTERNQSLEKDSSAV